MRVIPALVALVATVFRGRPAPRTIDVPLRDQPSRGGRVRGGRAARRRALAQTYSRAVLGHIVMRAPEVSADPAARRKWRNERKRARRAAR